MSNHLKPLIDDILDNMQPTPMYTLEVFQLNDWTTNVNSNILKSTTINDNKKKIVFHS